MMAADSADGTTVELKQGSRLMAGNGGGGVFPAFGLRQRLLLLWHRKVRLLVPSSGAAIYQQHQQSGGRRRRLSSPSSTSASSPTSTSVSFYSQQEQSTCPRRLSATQEPFSLGDEEEEEQEEEAEEPGRRRVEEEEEPEGGLLESGQLDLQQHKRTSAIPLQEMGQRTKENGLAQHRSTKMPSSSSVSSIPSPPAKHRPRRGPSCPPTSGASKAALVLSRAQTLMALLAFLSVLLVAVLITFLLTRDVVRAELANAQSDGPESAKLFGRVGQERDGVDVARQRPPGKSLAAPAPKLMNETSSREEEELLSSSEEQKVEGDEEEEDKDKHPDELGAEELRLSGELWPIWYNLSLRVYVPGFGAQIPADHNLSFHGDLLLKFRVEKAGGTRRVELNALKLQFDRQNLSQYQLTRTEAAEDGQQNTGTNATAIVKKSATAAVPKVVAVRVDEAREKVFFDLDAPLEQGAHFLFRIPYSGPIASKLSGLYLTSYTTLSGEQKCAAVTQMEPTDARRMVPCFDEPQFKAVYRLSVVHPLGSKAVSNAKETAEGIPTEEPDWLRTDFDETLPMSSYLLALVVSDFQFVEGHTRRGIRFRIWAREDAISLTAYALQAGIRVLEFYEDYYGIQFPLPKQDMMAFPDFAAGAMENWGLVTYREKYLLYSPQLYTAQQKMAVASVVAHELAHQWFGNLVTMRWWSDLWLNEGFATLMEYTGTDAISNGQFRMQDYFLVEALDSAFDRDSRATSHPLFFEIRKAEDVSEAFDSITYSKGASVLRMIRAVMGEESFKRGLNIYLNRFKYQNAEHSDLWDALTEAVPADLLDSQGRPFSVKQFARQWTEQTGYPVVQMRRLSSQRVSLSQQRFRLDHIGGQQKAKNGTTAVGNNPKRAVATTRPKASRTEEESPPSWEIPVWWSLNGTEQRMEWLSEGRQLEAGDQDVLVLNSLSQGFYRVHYGAEELQRIRQQLLDDHQNLSMASRVRIIDDTFTLAEGGYVPYEEALSMTRYLAQEKEYPPWEMALTGFTTIQNYFEDEPEAEDLRAYIKSIIGTLFDQELGRIEQWATGEEEKHFFDDLLRQRIVQRMCTLRDLRCIAAILDIYRRQFVQSCKPAATGPAVMNSTSSNNNSAELEMPKEAEEEQERRPRPKRHQMASQCSRVPVPFRTLAYCEGVHYGTEEDWELVLDLFRRETVQVEKERLLVALACSRDTYTLKRLLAMASDVNSTVIRLQDKPSVFTHVGSRIIGKKIVVDFFTDHWARIYEDFKDQQTLLRSIISSSIVGKSQRVIDQIQQFLRENQRTTRNLDVFKQRLEVLQTNTRWMERNFAKLAQWFRQQNSAHRRVLLEEPLSEEQPGLLPSPIARRRRR